MAPSADLVAILLVLAACVATINAYRLTSCHRAPAWVARCLPIHRANQSFCSARSLRLGAWHAGCRRAARGSAASRAGSATVCCQPACRFDATAQPEMDGTNSGDSERYHFDYRLRRRYLGTLSIGGLAHRTPMVHGARRRASTDRRSCD